jgi:hypothetical protein
MNRQFVFEITGESASEHIVEYLRTLSKLELANFTTTYWEPYNTITAYHSDGRPMYQRLVRFMVEKE